MRSFVGRSGKFWIILCLAVGISIGCAVDPVARVRADGAEGLERPTEEHKMAAKLISLLLPRKHISGQEPNEEISQRAMTIFLRSLDPMKRYFLQSDIDEFSRYKQNVAQMVKAGDLSAGQEVFTRFLQRVDERVATVQELLDEPFDFDVEESIVIDPDAARYPVDADEARDRWRKQLKYDLLVLKEQGKDEKEQPAASGEERVVDEPKEGDEAIEQLRRRYNRTAKRWHQMDSDQLLEIFLTSVTSSYDPHTTYMSPGSLDDFNIMMRLNLDGIGAALREKDGYTVVSKVIPGGAADRHGKLKEDDHIVSVGQGTDGEMVDIIEMPLQQVVKMIRGKAGTIVRLGVKTGGVGETKIYEIPRARVELEDSAARGEIIEHGEKADGSPMRFGYISLPSFYMDMEGARKQNGEYRSSTRDVRKILDRFKEKGIDAVVLDLSQNGGGSLTEAINLTGLFIGRGPVVQVKDSDGNIQEYEYENPDPTVAWDGPLVVMTSKFSASASEILAGAIQDYRRGLIVGDPQTHGKGTVQSLMELGRELFGLAGSPKLGALKVTLQQFYLPDGAGTQKEGVKADVVLPSLTTHMDIGEADLDYALEHDRIPAARHRRFNMVPSDVLGTVRARSADRISQDKEFVELLRKIDIYRSQKEEQHLSLKEADFVERRRQLDDREEKKREELEQRLGDTDETFRDYYYNREVLSIAADYVEGLRRQNLARVN